MNSIYYDGTKLLTLKDIQGLKPEIYMCCGNRTAGKTYYFKRMLLRRFIKMGSKFCCLVRFVNELPDYHVDFFKDICNEKDLEGHTMTSKPVRNGLFQELYFDEMPCGYVVALNSADKIKKNSSRFIDVDAIFFDEFQSESKTYCPDEITKFQSIHASMARGGGKQVRYLPVYMCSNTVSVLNPYFSAFGIGKRLNKDTKYLRGDGWVLEMTYNENAATEFKQSGFGRAFQQSSYAKYAADNSFLLDNNHFIEKLHGDARLYFVINCDGNDYGVWMRKSDCVMFVNRKVDPSFPFKLTFKTADHNINYMMVQFNKANLKTLKNMFECGAVRFEDMECKDVFLDMIGYSLI